jgi:hypothetical protein
MTPAHTRTVLGRPKLGSRAVFAERLVARSR